MLTITLPTPLEAAVVSAAQRSGLSVDDYLASVCGEALSLELDRARVDSFLAGTPGVPHERAQAWLLELANGKRGECPR